MLALEEDVIGAIFGSFNSSSTLHVVFLSRPHTKNTPCHSVADLRFSSADKVTQWRSNELAEMGLVNLKQL